MKRYFALTIICVIVVLSCFNYFSLFSILNEREISPTSFEISSGEVVHLNIDDLDVVLNALNLEVHSKQEISGRTIIEGYSAKLSDYIVIDNMKTNIQIAISEDDLIVGYPLINSSF